MVGGLCLAGLVALALPVVSKSLLFPLETGLTPAGPIQAAGPPAAIVILAGDVTDTVPSVADFRAIRSIPGPLTLERLKAGAELYRSTGLPILVSGGSPRPGSQTMAAIMAEALRDDFKVPVRWQETQSQTTWENAEGSAVILKAAGIESVYLVTQAWHMPRSLMSFAHFGIAATPSPAYLDEPPYWGISQFIPRPSAWLNSYYALHEWIGLAAYARR